MMSPLSPRRLALLFVPFALAASTCAADTPRSIWLISTRGIDRCAEADDAESLQYWRLDADCSWSPANAREFNDEPSQGPTMVFVHGNGTDANEAVTKGLFVYRSISCAVGDKPFRYVIWSWDSDRVYLRPKRDAQLKREFSNHEGFALAGWLARLRPDVKVSLVGHSFGPRIICGALHLLAGGDIEGRVLSEAASTAWNAKKQNPMRAVLLAAAENCKALAPGGRFERALSLLDDVLVTSNGCDRILKHYPQLNGRGGPEAMGFVGPWGLAEAANVTVLDVSCSVGKPHNYRGYCDAPDVCAQWARYTFLEDNPVVNASTANSARPTPLILESVLTCTVAWHTGMPLPVVPTPMPRLREGI